MKILGYFWLDCSGDKVDPLDHCKAAVSNVQFPRIYKSAPPVTNNSLFLKDTQIYEFKIINICV